MARREGTHIPAVRAASERSLGITERCAPIAYPWNADIRKRYTDFLVYEIRKDGTVVHLYEFEVDEEQEKLALQFAQSNSNARSFTPLNNGRNQANSNRNFTSVVPVEDPKEPMPIPNTDKEVLEDLIGKSATTKLIQLDGYIQTKKQVPVDERNIVFDPIPERTRRAVVHQEIRRIFDSRIETLANNIGVITATAAKQSGGGRRANHGLGSRRDGNRGQNKSLGQLGGDYLHFTIYKENKDTMDAVNTLARLLKIKATNFGFAGTKDRRAGTTQRISVFRQRASNLIWINSRLPNLKVGDFEYSKSPLQLGQHGGNEFIITLKNCQPLGQGAESQQLGDQLKMLQKSVETGLWYLRHRGYLNYFGLQRFGTYSIGTHLLGMKILKGNYESVIDDILHVEAQYIEDILDNNVPQAQGPTGDNNRDDFARAKALTTWKLTKNAQKALEILPKRFSSESAIIQHLGKNPKDFVGAILSITRGMRMMYIHAYQSYVWNHVASKRWSRHGDKVVVGDLVLISGREGNDLSDSTIDAGALSDTEDDGNFYAQAKVLTKEDVTSGRYTIFDVVLPTPGFDVMYPQNDIGDYYREFMAREENGDLDPFHMRRKQKEFSLSGSYRHLLGRFIADPEFAIQLYSEDTQQMYPTDLDFALHYKHNKAQNKIPARRQPSAHLPDQTAKDSGLIARWADFAKNSSTYDQLTDTNRRRRASASPPSDGVTTKQNIWVETGLDGSAKRVKIARHSQPVVNDGVETGDVTSKDASEQTNEDTPMKDGSPRVPEQKENIPISGVPKATVEDSEDPHGWYGGLVPNLNTTSRAESMPPADTPNTKERGPAPTKIGKVVLPTFCKLPADPHTTVNDFSHELASKPAANKIAIILKFQLKASNYATIVLRELMGSTIEGDTVTA